MIKRPKYHFTPKQNWINDPNGLCYHKGLYHLYYQYNPKSTMWGLMHWGHAVSRDLMTWENKDIALALGGEYDKDGCFSGSAIEHNNELHIFYTGVNYKEIKYKNGIPLSANLNAFTPTEMHAVSKDGGMSFEKLEPAVITDERFTDKVHVRDPKVWKTKEGFYRMVLGNTEKHRHGSLVFYKSHDLYKWEYEGKWFDTSFGWGWECPDFFELDGYEVFMFSPMGAGDNIVPNISMYLTGRMDFQNFDFDWENKGLLDECSDIYAPQTFMHDGRRIMIGWIRMLHPFDGENYTGMMTIPRKLSVKNGRLFSYPVEETLSKRKEKVHEKTANEHKINIEENVYDMEISFTENTNISLYQSEKGDGFYINYKKDESILTIDRSSALNGYTGIAGYEKKDIYLPLNKKVDLRIIADNSIIEIFINGGEKSAACVMPSNEKGIEIKSSGELKCKIWRM